MRDEGSSPFKRTKQGIIKLNKLSKMENKGKLIGIKIDGKYIPVNAEASISSQDLTSKPIIEVKDGKAYLNIGFRPDNEENYYPTRIMFSTKMPDGIYNQDDITFEISDGIRDIDFAVGCYVLHTKEYATKHNIPVFI